MKVYRMIELLSDLDKELNMCDLWINWRFGARHLQIGPRGITFQINSYWLHNKPASWFQRY